MSAADRFQSLWPMFSLASVKQLVDNILATDYQVAKDSKHPLLSALVLIESGGTKSYNCWFPKNWTTGLTLLCNKEAHLRMIVRVVETARSAGVVDEENFDMFLDGIRRNYIYHTELRELLVEDVQERFYDNIQRPPKFPNDAAPPAFLKTWLLQEYQIGHHDPASQALFAQPSDEVDVFDLSEHDQSFFTRFIIIGITRNVEERFRRW